MGGERIEKVLQRRPRAIGDGDGGPGNSDHNIIGRCERIKIAVSRDADLNAVAVGTGRNRVKTIRSAGVAS